MKTVNFLMSQQSLFLYPMIIRMADISYRYWKQEYSSIYRQYVATPDVQTETSHNSRISAHPWLRCIQQDKKDRGLCNRSTLTGRIADLNCFLQCISIPTVGLTFLRLKYQFFCRIVSKLYKTQRLKSFTVCCKIKKNSYIFQ